MKDPNRRSGRTTRIIDKSIQTLFKQGEVLIEDHYCSDVEGAEHGNNIRVAEMVLARLRREHGLEVKNNEIHVDKDQLSPYVLIEFSPTLKEKFFKL